LKFLNEEGLRKLLSNLKTRFSNKQDKITATGSANLLLAPSASGGQPTTKAVNTLLASPAAQTANTQLLVAPATQGNAPTLKPIADFIQKSEQNRTPIITTAGTFAFQMALAMQALGMPSGSASNGSRLQFQSNSVSAGSRPATNWLTYAVDIYTAPTWTGSGSSTVITSLGDWNAVAKRDGAVGASYDGDTYISNQNRTSLINTTGDNGSIQSWKQMTGQGVISPRPAYDWVTVRLIHAEFQFDGIWARNPSHLHADYLFLGNYDRVLWQYPHIEYLQVMDDQNVIINLPCDGFMDYWMVWENIDTPQGVQLQVTIQDGTSVLFTFPRNYVPRYVRTKDITDGFVGGENDIVVQMRVKNAA